MKKKNGWPLAFNSEIDMRKWIEVSHEPSQARALLLRNLDKAQSAAKNNFCRG
jgi:hypothetical protein